MSKKPNSQKIKIISSKDVVSLLLIAVILFCSFTYCFAAIKPVYNGDYGGGGYANVSANDLYKLQMASEKIHNSAYDIYTKNLKVKSESLDKALNFGNAELPDKAKDKIDKNEWLEIFNNLRSSGWKIANYTTVGTVTENNKKFPMAAYTYIRQDASTIDIVISYRSTISGDAFEMLRTGKLFNSEWKENLTKLVKEDKFNTGNWGQNIAAIFLGYTGMEDDAQVYATKVAKYYNTHKGSKTLNIHVTGQSLGGYLAQIGGAKLLQHSTYKKYVKQITYFNGFGLYVNNKFSSIIWVANEISTKFQKIINEMYDYELSIKEIDSIIQNAYKTLKNNKKIVTLYRIKGDWVSPLGHHAGNIKEFYVSNSSLKSKQSNNSTNTLQTTLKILHTIGLLSIDCSSYPRIYKIADFESYLWATHELSAFQDWDLVTENRVVDIETAYFSNIPETIKKGAEKTITLTIKLNNAELKENLSKSDFSVSKNLTIISVTQSSANKKIDYNKPYETIYTIKIKVKATKMVILPSITMKADAFKISPYPKGPFSKLNIYNNSLTSNYIAIKL